MVHIMFRILIHIMIQVVFHSVVLEVRYLTHLLDGPVLTLDLLELSLLVSLLVGLLMNGTGVTNQ